MKLTQERISRYLGDVKQLSIYLSKLKITSDQPEQNACKVKAAFHLLNAETELRNLLESVVGK